MAGLGDLVGGFQGGYDFTTKARRNRQLEQAIDYELSDLGTKQMGKRSAIDLAREAEGGEQVDWSKFQQAEDPYLFKMAGGIKDYFKRKFGDNAPYAGQPPAEQQGVPANRFGPMMANGGRALAPNRTAGHYRNGGFAIPNPVGSAGRGAYYADGGEVTDEEEARLKRSYGEHYLTRAEAAERVVGPGAGMSGATQPRGRPGVQAIPTSGGGIGEFGRDVGRAIGLGKSATEKGEMFRENLGNVIGATADSLKGAVSPVADAYRGVADFAGAVTGVEPTAEEAAVRQAVKPDETQTPNVAAQPAAAGGGGAAGPAQQPQAVSTSGEANVPGAGVGGAATWDDVTQIPGMTPDDMPSMNTQDWIAYRSTRVSDLIAMGASPTEAHQQVTQMQQRGFMSNAQRASFALQQGDTRAAALNLKAAYQYFPNGADVKFGMAQDKNGRPALVAMGTNEETGEPQGNPILLNEERLAAMIQNFQSPDAFTAWTKDWRDEQFKDKKYNELDKPKAEQAMRTSAAQADYYRSGALANAQKAAGGGGGIKASDRDRAAKDEFKDRAFAVTSVMDLDDPDQLSADLTQVMGEIYTMNPNVPPTTISNEVIQAFRLREQDGGQAMAQLLRRYGLVQ